MNDKMIKEQKTENKKGYKSGFVAILGRANAGKSTLINRFIGEKISIVSPKPQTTRNKITGILTTENYQIIFEDTPGLLKSNSKLSEFMKKSLDSAGSGTDIIIVLIDATRGIGNDDVSLIEKYMGRQPNFLCLVNKVDEAKPEQVFPILKYLTEKEIKDVFPVSAKTGENCDKVFNRLIELLPVGLKYFPEEMHTDKNERFMAAEIIREKMLFRYQQEIPHGIGINITKFNYVEEKNITEIDAEIFCEKDGHKAIIIGKNGSGLKTIGTDARRDIEKMTGNKVFLTLWVKVKEQWRDSDYLLKELGYNKNHI